MSADAIDGTGFGGSGETGPIVAIRQFVDAFNSNDVDRARAACADETRIIDDIPPHEWAGPGAIAGWFRDLARLSAEYEMSHIAVTLKEARHVVVTERMAYVVVPIDVRWLDHGTAEARTGAMTCALREEPDGWRISALAWTWSVSG